MFRGRLQLEDPKQKKLESNMKIWMKCKKLKISWNEASSNSLQRQRIEYYRTGEEELDKCVQYVEN